MLNANCGLALIPPTQDEDRALEQAVQKSNESLRWILFTPQLAHAATGSSWPDGELVDGLVGEPHADAHTVLDAVCRVTRRARTTPNRGQASTRDTECPE